MTSYTKVSDSSGSYSAKKIASVFSPIPFVILILILFFVYHDVNLVLATFFFVMLALVILIPYLLFPVGNIALLFYIDKFYNFILDFANIEGDSFTYFIVWAIVLIYISLNITIFIASFVTLYALMTGKMEGIVERIKKLSVVSMYEKPEAKRGNTLIVVFLIVGIFIFILLMSVITILLIR